MNVVRQIYPEFTGEANPVARSISARDIKDLLKRTWRLLLITTTLSLAIGALYIMTSPVKYTAQADMIIDTKRTSWSQSELATENRSVEDASVESEIETTKSEKVALSVIRRFRLTEDPEFIGVGQGLIRKVISSIRSAPPIQPKVSDNELTLRALATFKDSLRVTRLGRSYIEQIAFTSVDKEKAASIANAVADAYIEDQLQAKFEATRRASAWLELRIGDLRQQASDAYKQVQDFKSDNNIIIGVDGKLASEVELDQLGIALAKARADTSQARAKLDRITRVLEQRSDLDKGGLAIPDPIVTDALSNPVITRLRQQYLDDQNKESEWSTRYGSNHQAARNLRAEMSALQRSIWDEISRIAESYKSELQIARSQEESIDRRMIEVFEKSGTTRQSQVRLRELETAANTYRGIYETFLSRFTQSVQQQSFPSTEARLVTAASAPRAPSSPKVGLTLALAGISGLALGLLAGLIREQMNRQIHTRAEIEQLLGVNCLAVLPLLPAAKMPLVGGQYKREWNAYRAICDAPPFSATAEALRCIKVAIDLYPTGPKLIGVISALPGEGKTTVAASFGAFLAKNGARTLLIDADLRNPSMTKSLGQNSGKGLMNIIAKKAEFRKSLVSDNELKLDFLPASLKNKPSNSSDILTSDAMKELLKKVSQDYDYVIVDLPPVLPVVDVKAAAHLFDAFVMVIEWGSTSADDILRALKVSPVVSDKLLGTVLNKADEVVMRRFEGYSDRHYGYYSDEKAGVVAV